MKRFLLLPVVLLAIGSSVFAGGGKESEEAAAASSEPKNLIIAVQDLPQAAISAMAENSNVAIRIDFSVEENLIQTDYYDNYKLKPGLAESWELVDEKTLRFKLRKGVKFHNGEEMTAEDVAFTFGKERLLSENAPGRAVAASFLSNIESVTAIDDYTVEIKGKNPDALFLTRFANFPSQIISKKGYEDAGSWEEFGRKPVGTGPYKVTEYTDGQRIVIERLADYWGGDVAAVDRVEFRKVPELATRIAGLRSGEFDIITEVPPDQAEAINKMSGVSVVRGPIRTIYGMFFDETSDTPMADPRIREALTLSIDRRLLVDTLFGGYTTIPNNWQMKLFGDMYLEDYPGLEYNPRRAKELIKEAGYHGEKIVYRILPGYYTMEQIVSEAVTQMWQDVGFNVELQVKENWNQILEDNDERNIFNGSFSAYYPDPVGQFWRRFGPATGGAYGGLWTNPDEFVKLGSVLETNYDLNARRDAFEKMMDIFNKDPKGVYLYNLPMIYGVRDGVKWNALPIEGMDLTKAALEL